MRKFLAFFSSCLLSVFLTGVPAEAGQNPGAGVRAEMLADAGFTFDLSTLPGVLEAVPPRALKSSNDSYTEWGVRDQYEFVAVVVRGSGVSDQMVMINIGYALIHSTQTCVRATNVVFSPRLKDAVLYDCSLSVLGRGDVYFSVAHFTYVWDGAEHRYSVYVRNGGGTPTTSVRTRLREIMRHLVYAAPPVG